MVRFRNNRNEQNYNGYNNGYSRYNNSYIYGQPNVTQFAAVPGIQVPVNDFELNFRPKGNRPISIVFEAGGFLHNLVYSPVKTNTRINKDRVESGDFVLDNQKRYDSLFEVLNKHNN